MYKYNMIHSFVQALLAILPLTCADITVPLSPTTATLYSLVEFTCEGHGGDLGWIINGDSITDITKQNRAISIITNTSNGTISSVLTIVSLPVNDGIIISCFIGTNIHDLAYSSASLTIRGISPVENISLDLNSSMLYWSPPSSVPLQYQPLLSYIVNITEPIIIVYTTNNTFLLLPSLTTCRIVTKVTVTSNSYSSKMAHDVHAISKYNSTTISIRFITYYKIVDTFDVTFTITVFGYVCDNTTITGITRVINTNENTLYKHQSIHINGVNGLVTVNYTIHLNSSMSYTFIALINDSIGNIDDESDSVYFTTYHVQDVSVYQVDDLVRVECTFIYQSIADGCHIKLTTDGSIIQSFNIYLNESNIASQYITLSVNGIYSITAYDIFNGIITDTPSVHYDDIFQYISSVTSDIIATPGISDTPLPLTSQLLPSSILPSNITTTIFPVLPVAITVSITIVFVNSVMIVFAIFSAVYCFIRNQSNPSVDPHIVTVSNESYSTVVLTSSLPTTTNPAYEHIIIKR